MNIKKKKYLFVYLKTGGGHLAPAKSVANYYEKHREGQVESILVDGFAESNKLVKFIIEDGYRIAQNKSKWIYELIYALNKIEIAARITASLTSIFIEKYLRKTIAEEKPDQIIVFHFLTIRPIYKALKRLNEEIPVTTVVTDPYIAHPLWFLNKDQKFIVFSNELKKRCVKKGIEENNISVFPFILDEKFSTPAPIDRIESFKENLGFNGKKVLLVLGGGDGIPKGKSILKKLLKLGKDFDIALVCGKNKKLYDYANKLKEKGNYDNLKVFGFVNYVYELINISDIVITKCGASTFMEVLMLRKIPVVNSYIWEQEKGNVDFLIENHLGVYEKRVKKLPLVINDFFANKDHMNDYKKNIENLSFKNGTKYVAEFLYKLV